MTFFFAIRSMTRDPIVPGMDTEGTLWFKDLTKKDHVVLMDSLFTVRALALACAGTMVAVVAVIKILKLRACSMGI